MRKRRELSRGFVRISEAARILGVHRAQAWRIFRRHAVRTQHSGKILLVPVARVYKELSNRLLEDMPLTPEIAEFREELDALEETLERVCQGLAKVARKTGVSI